MLDKIRVFCLALCMSLLIGCGGGDAVKEINSQATNVPPNASYDQVKRAIQQAGIGLGWQMKEVQRGLIRGTLFIRSHVAKVDIPFDTNTYSIKYKDSSEDLNYDGTTIHGAYNRWVTKLDQRIQAQLSAI